MKVGVADTTFARVDMATPAIQVLEEGGVEVERYTVPGFKDLPVAALKLFEEHGCDLVMALGMAGGQEIDRQCAHEASTAIQQVQLMVKKHLLEVFVHMDETPDEQEIKDIAVNRATKHAHNALALLKGKTELSSQAGHGLRQGKDDEGAIQ